MTDQWTDRLSDHLDDELDAATRADLDAHLAACADCTSTLQDLRAVAARAASLTPVPPSAELWPGVEAQLSRGVLAPFRLRPARRFSFTFPQLVAAGLALMVLSGGGVWISQVGGRNTSLPLVEALEPT